MKSENPHRIEVEVRSREIYELDSSNPQSLANSVESGSYGDLVWQQSDPDYIVISIDDKPALTHVVDEFPYNRYCPFCHMQMSVISFDEMIDERTGTKMTKISWGCATDHEEVNLKYGG